MYLPQKYTLFSLHTPTFYFEQHHFGLKIIFIYTLTLRKSVQIQYYKDMDFNY